MRAGLNMRTLTRVISYLKEWCHTLWHILSFCYVAVLEGFCFCSGAHRRVQAASGPTDLQSFACWTHPRLLDVDMEQWMWTVPHVQGQYSANNTLRTMTHTKGSSVIQCPVPCLHSGAADERFYALRTFRSVSGCSPVVTIWSKRKGLS